MNVGVRRLIEWSVVATNDRHRRFAVDVLDSRVVVPPTVHDSCVGEKLVVRYPQFFSDNSESANGTPRTAQVTSGRLLFFRACLPRGPGRPQDAQRQSAAIHIIEGITEITPKHITIQSLKTARSVKRKIQIPTNSVSREVLNPVIHRTLDRKNLVHRTSVVEFYLRAERLDDAMAELKEVVRDFPSRPTANASAVAFAERSLSIAATPQPPRWLVQKRSS